jgi:hypothetical protein
LARGGISSKKGLRIDFVNMIENVFLSTNSLFISVFLVSKVRTDPKEKAPERSLPHG